MDNNIVFVNNGDIFTSELQTLVNPVNCQCVMGAGLAKEFSIKFPEMYEDYKRRCKSREIRIGVPILWKGSTKWILNFPTKDKYKYPSRLEWIEKGLEYFVNNYKNWGIESIAFPGLGCNLGGLSWIDVKPIMEKYLIKPDIPIEIYVPSLTPIESILEKILNDFKEFSNDVIKEITIVRAIYPKSDGWTDWKKQDQLRVLLRTDIDKYKDAIESKLEKLNNHRFKTKIGIYAKEILFVDIELYDETKLL